VTPAEAAKRIGAAAASRPLLAHGRPEDILGRQLSERAPHFESVARSRFRTDGLTVSQVVEEIRRWLSCVR
jgi:shikimate kinase